MKTAVLVLCLGLISVSWALSLKEARDAFIDFQVKYNRTYATPSEFKARFAVFQQNLAKAAEHQKRNPKARFGVTKFMDLTEEEFNRYKMPSGLFKSYVAPAAKTDFTSTKPRNVQVSPDPTNFDWGSSGCVTPVYDQGQCGSCWAFSATETIESYYCLQGGALTQLSMEQIVDCDTDGQDQGCNGGFPSGAYQYVESAGGLDSLASYPYTAGGGDSGSCEFSSGNVVTDVASFQSINGEQGLYQQLSSSSGGPVSVCVDASSWQTYQGGVLTSCGDNVDHCVQLTGYYNYNQDNAYWNVRNSWNTDWGVNGYIWVAIGQDLCSIGDYATIVADTN